MKEKENKREIIGIFDNDEDDAFNAIPEYIIKFKQIWTFHIYPCQKKYLFDTKIYAAPSFQVRGSRML